MYFDQNNFFYSLGTKATINLAKNKTGKALINKETAQDYPEETDLAKNFD